MTACVPIYLFHIPGMERVQGLCTDKTCLSIHLSSDLTNVCSHHGIWCAVMTAGPYCCSASTDAALHLCNMLNICQYSVSDWETLNWAKMAALIDNSTEFTYGMGLIPWYLPGYILPAGKAAIFIYAMHGFASGTSHCTCVRTADSIPHYTCIYTADMQRTACVTAHNQELLPQHCNVITMPLLQKLDVSTLICMVCQLLALGLSVAEQSTVCSRASTVCSTASSQQHASTHRRQQSWKHIAQHTE